MLAAERHNLPQESIDRIEAARERMIQDVLKYYSAIGVNATVNRDGIAFPIGAARGNQSLAEHIINEIARRVDSEQPRLVHALCKENNIDRKQFDFETGVYRTVLVKDGSVDNADALIEWAHGKKKNARLIALTVALHDCILPISNPGEFLDAFYQYKIFRPIAVIRALHELCCNNPKHGVQKKKYYDKEEIEHILRGVGNGTTDSQVLLRLVREGFLLSARDYSIVSQQLQPLRNPIDFFKTLWKNRLTLKDFVNIRREHPDKNKFYEAVEREKRLRMPLYIESALKYLKMGVKPESLANAHELARLFDDKQAATLANNGVLHEFASEFAGEFTLEGKPRQLNESEIIKLHENSDVGTHHLLGLLKLGISPRENLFAQAARVLRNDPELNAEQAVEQQRRVNANAQPTINLSIATKPSVPPQPAMPPKRKTRRKTVPEPILVSEQRFNRELLPPGAMKKGLTRAHYQRLYEHLGFRQERVTGSHHHFGRTTEQGHFTAGLSLKTGRTPVATALRHAGVTKEEYLNALQKLGYARFKN